jgi:hypothetical protein
MAATDYVNIMAYSPQIKAPAGVNAVLNEFVTAGVPKEKIMFGIATKLTQVNEIAPIAKIILEGGYGGIFFWGTGQGYPVAQPYVDEANKCLGLN